MNQTSLKSLVADGTIRTISNLRVNENGYPYLTMIGKPRGEKNTSLNVYFGKRSGGIILDNFEIGDNVVKELRDASILKTENADGETRWKISLPAVGGNYVAASELQEVFGIEEIVTEFDVAEFRAQFATAAVPAAPVEDSVKPVTSSKRS